MMQVQRAARARAACGRGWRDVYENNETEDHAEDERARARAGKGARRGARCHADEQTSIPKPKPPDANRI